MTRIQIEAANLKEQQRANKAKERENERSNREREKETHRANKAEEGIRKYSEGRQTISDLADIFNSSQRNKSSKLSSMGSAAASLATVLKLLNDNKWYMVSEQVTKDVASISAFQPTGTIPTNDDSIGIIHDIQGLEYTKDEGHKFAVAGYCHFPYLPSIGQSYYARNNSDGVNITAQNIYSFVRKSNSGASNYQRADYMMYLLAVDSPLGYYSWMKRLYGLLNYANIYNKYLPRHLMNDMNVSYDDLSKNMAQLRAYINMFAVRINASLAIPSKMPYYIRHQFLNTYMFSDSSSKKHQLYFFSPKAYFIWKIDPNNNATMLDLETPWSYTGATVLTLDDIAAFGNYLLETLINQEDVGLMVGDTIKAFGEESMASVPQIPEDYTLEIGTSDEILDQITNIKFAKKGIISRATRPYSTSGYSYMSVVGYEPLNGVTPVTHTYDMRVFQNVNDQQIYQSNLITVNQDFSSMPNAAKSIWNAADITGQDIIAVSDGEHDVELNFVTDDTSPERVTVATRLTPVIKWEKTTVTRDGSNNISKAVAEYRIEACGSEIVTEGFTSVLYWDTTDGKAKVATYELFDGMCEFASSYGGTNGAYGTEYTGNECFISDFDYHPCINIYHTMASGVYPTSAIPNWLRRYAKLWDRNVSTRISRATLGAIHAAAIMGEFNVAELGLKPRATLK